MVAGILVDWLAAPGSLSDWGRLSMFVVWVAIAFFDVTSSI
jgi:hypothetical protein